MIVAEAARMAGKGPRETTPPRKALSKEKAALSH